MEDRFRVASSPVAVPLRLKLWSEGRMVINLAVEDDPDRLVLVRHRLVAASHIHDRQPPMSQPARPFHPEPLVVRPPMAQGITHPRQARLIRSNVWIQPDAAY